MGKYVNRKWRCVDNKEENERYWVLEARDESTEPWYEVLRMCQDKDDPEIWWYVSPENMLNSEYDCISAETLADAKEQFEDMYGEHLDDLAAKYQCLRYSWDEQE